MRKKIRKCYMAVILLAVLLSGCSGLLEEADIQEESDARQEENVEIQEAESIDDAGLNEDMSVYDADDPDSLVYFYVTVRMGNEGAGTNHTFDEVKNAIRFVDEVHVDSEVFAEALVQVGDSSGPQQGMLGYGETASNATIRIRGNTASLMPQKSYKLSLNDNAGLWRGQSNIALNKHSSDATRLRNKLYFDLAKQLPEVPSLRTQFVRLFVKDETAGEAAFSDYGLYTQVEVPTKKYLSNHGLDRSGYLYKAIAFNFEPNEKLKNFDDPEFQLEQMNSVVKCKGRQDNERLLEMIDAVNDNSIDINEIIDTYFDRENYENWLLFNILMGNIDTTVQNFYLYSPLNGNRWYFIPWDSDDSLKRYERKLKGGSRQYDEWEMGISNYWGLMLHQRFLKNEKNREELRQKAREMHEWLNAESVDKLAQEYNALLEPYISQMPDIMYLQCTLEERNQVIAGLGKELEDNYRIFEESLEWLMPFFMFEAKESQDTLLFTWEEAYDFKAEDIRYHIWVSRYPDMSNPVVDQSGLEALSLEVPKTQLEAGTYYWKVTASTEDGRVMGALNELKVNDIYYPGVMKIEVG
ncbi:MAG: CotH kinase family protein [Hungatella hathewayi]|nr:CotH kinase family protein [Hungatella hathewayi]